MTEENVAEAIEQKKQKSAEVRLSVVVDKDKKAVSLVFEADLPDRPVRISLNYSPLDAAKLSMTLARAAHALSPVVKPGTVFPERHQGGLVLPR